MKKALSVILGVLMMMTFVITSLGASVPVDSIKITETNNARFELKEFWWGNAKNPPAWIAKTGLTKESGNGEITLQTGQKYTLKVAVTPADATNKKLTYSSGNKNIATVNKNGIIKGVKAGKTVITVISVSNKKAVAKCSVNVIQFTISSDIVKRVKNRTFPSLFQAWGNILNLPEEDALTKIARHDVAWWAPGDVDGLVWNSDYRVLATGFTGDSIKAAREWRKKLLELNPNMILLANINYRGVKADWLPENHEWWWRNPKGEKIVSWMGKVPWYRLDFRNPGLRAKFAEQCAFIVNSGVYDGVLLDWWDEGNASELPGRLELLKAIRSAIPSHLIIANSNDRKPVFGAPYLNGIFMETGTKEARVTTPERWKQIQETLEWNQANMLEPKINCFEVWYAKSFDELYRMRAATTMSLTLSDGYCLFGAPNGELSGVDHQHNWHAFWDKSAGGLGKAVAKGSLQANGSYMRQYENGYAVYNPMGNGPVTVTFPVDYKSVATGETKKEHTVPDQDGDIFLIAK